MVIFFILSADFFNYLGSEFFFIDHSAPRENTVITGTSKLKVCPIFEMQYLDSKSMKLKNSKNLKSMISTLKS